MCLTPFTRACLRPSELPTTDVPGGWSGGLGGGGGDGAGGEHWRSVRVLPESYTESLTMQHTKVVEDPPDRYSASPCQRRFKMSTLV